MDQNSDPQRVPPFVQEEPPNLDNDSQIRGTLSTSLMIISLMALTISLIGGAKLVIDVLLIGFSPNQVSILAAQTIALSVAYLFGWVIALICVRALGNLLLPYIVNVYAGLVVVGISLLYIRVIYKLFLQGYDPFRYMLYLLTMLGGIISLVGLHLIEEGHDLRPFSLPILSLSVIQLIAIVVRYVFVPGANPSLLLYDVGYFAFMILISILMMAHFGVLEGIRRLIKHTFQRNSHYETG